MQETAGADIFSIMNWYDPIPSAEKKGELGSLWNRSGLAGLEMDNYEKQN
ncbi:MAG: hypothetical protein P9L90_07295 [Candidatus Aadella gelida]|nr:hypothetical protein [Candidatus Aadella gelida]